MKIPRSISNLIEAFEKLPGVGPKTAQRLAFYLLHVPQTELESFAESLSNLKKMTVLCSVCKNVAEGDPCPVCSDHNREQSVIMVVEQPLDVLAIERAGKYKGLYHVLHGAINPLENIGPDEIYVEDLVIRVKPSSVHSAALRTTEGQRSKRKDDKTSGQIEEVIIATNPTMEGDATAMYLSSKLKSINKGIKVTRLGMGIPTGADLEYADEVTLREAINGRREI